MSRSSKCLRSFLVSKRSPSFVYPLDPDAGSLAVERPLLRRAVSRYPGHDLLCQHLFPNEPLVPGAGARQPWAQLPEESDPVGHLELLALAQRLDPVRELANQTLRPKVLVEAFVHGDNDATVGLCRPRIPRRLQDCHVVFGKDESLSSCLDFPAIA